MTTTKDPPSLPDSSPSRRDQKRPHTGAASPKRGVGRIPTCSENARSCSSRTRPSITEPLAEALGREGFDTQVAGTVAEALELAERVDPDLVLLDVMLPDGSGFDVCRELRRRSQVPIIMLTARGEEADRIVGLELGADDYVVKPFSAREVVARIRAVLRRTDAPTQSPRTSRSRSARCGSTRPSAR